MSDEMALAHGRDYTAQAAMQNAARALGVLLDDPTAGSRIYPQDREAITALRDILRKRIDHVVAVWD